MIPDPIVGLILAGGQARRMGGGDKPLQILGGRTLLARIVDRLRPQCASLVLNADGDATRFGSFGLPVVADTAGEHLGPLAGILAGLDWAADHAPTAELVLSVPGDAPFLPSDLCKRLRDARNSAGADLAVAESGERLHHVICLWPVALRHGLRMAILNKGVRKVEMFAQQYQRCTASWPDTPVDPFFNINRPEDLVQAEARLALAPRG